MILVSLDRSFGGVGVMEVQGGNMKIYAILVHELLQAGGVFIFQHLEEREEAAVTKVGVEDLVGTTKFFRAE